MNILKKYILNGTLISGVASFFFATLAAASSGVSIPKNVITSPDDIVALFCGTLNWLFWGLIVLSIIMFLFGGYTYVTSGGDAEKVGKATKTLTYAAIGVVVALIAQGIPSLIGSFLGSSADVNNACTSVSSTITYQ